MATRANDIRFNIAYHPTPYPQAMRKDLVQIGEVCDGVYIPVTESDLAYMANKIKYCIETSKELDMVPMVDLWGYGNLFACGAVPSLFTVQHPEHNCVTNTGRTIPKSCPNKPAVRAFFRDAIESFVEVYEPGGFFLDEPGWGLAGYLGQLTDGEWACRCKDCMRLFRERYGVTMPRTVTRQVGQFRAESMLRFLSELCGYVKACGEHFVTSTCVMTSDAKSFQNAVGKTRNLDVFGIDPYWRRGDALSQEEFVDRHTGAAVTIGGKHDLEVESWVCAWQLNAGEESDVYYAAKLMASHDIDYLSAWSYRDHVSWTPCTKPNQADPELVWKHLRRAFQEIRRGKIQIVT
ncbi:MAG: hypothetical protein GWP08_20960 [Nitrospiraceae bacterium]|nr:hypothetical protein [Nitrospiraceae bacterium]